MAYFGFNRWQREMFGKREHELAQRILLAAMKTLRETTEARIFFDSTKPDISITKVTDGYKELDSALMEARVLWGESRLQEPQQKIRVLIRTILSHMSAVKPPNKGEDFDVRFQKMIDASSFFLMIAKDDPWISEFEEAVKMIEKTLFQYLPRPRQNPLRAIWTQKVRNQFNSIVRGVAEATGGHEDEPPA